MSASAALREATQKEMKKRFPNLNPDNDDYIIDCEPVDERYLMFTVDLIMLFRNQLQLKQIYGGYYSIYNELTGMDQYGLVNTVGFSNLDNINEWINEDGYVNIVYFAYPIDEMDNMVESIVLKNGDIFNLNDWEFEEKIFIPTIRKRFNMSLDEPMVPIVNVGAITINGLRHRTIKMILTK